MNCYTDGSCIKNKYGGWAFYIEDEELLFSGNEENTTNNRMELIAVLELLEILIEDFNCKKCIINTDSKLTLNCAQGIYKRNKNLDLWKKFHLLNSKIEIEWVWVKAHNGNEFNELVDKHAYNEAKSLIVSYI